MPKRKISTNWMQRWISPFLVAFAGLPFTFWFKTKQLDFLSPGLSRYYPASRWLETYFIIVSIFLAIWALIEVCLTKPKKISLIAIAPGAIFFSFDLTLTKVPFSYCFLLFCLCLFALFGFQIRAVYRSRAEAVRRHAFAVLLLFAVHFFFLGSSTPLVWNYPITSYYSPGESAITAVGSPAFRIDYVNSKRLNFSGYDYSFWGSSSYVPISLHSYVFSLLPLAFDVPTADPAGFHRMLKSLMFFAAVVGAFGFYLFLLYGLNLSYPVALIGGSFFLLNNFPMSMLETLHWPAFSTFYYAMPYALLFFKLALIKRRLLFGFFAGLALSVSFLIMPAHPDPIIQGIVYFSLYVVWHLIYRLRSDWKLPLGVGLAAGAGFILGSSFYVAPIVDQVRTHEANYFGHVGTIFLYTFSENYTRRVLWPLVTLGPLVALALSQIKTLRAKIDRRPDLWFFIFTGLLTFIFFGSGTDGFFAQLPGVQVPGFQSQDFYRVLSWASLSLLVLSAFGLNAAGESRRPARILVIWLLTSALCLAILAFIYRGEEVFKVSDVIFRLPVLAACALAASFLIPDAFIRRWLPLPLTAAILFISPMRLLYDNGHWTGNPKGCLPYISLRTDLVNYNVLRFDKTNLDYLKNRLIMFEEEVQNASSKAKYFGELAKAGVQSARLLSHDQIEIFAKTVAPVVDDYYFSNFCFFAPGLPPEGHDAQRIAEYNDALLYENVGDPWLRIMEAARSNSHFGIAQGYFLQNSTPTAAIEWLQVFPPINALYVMPGWDYRETGTDGARSPWKSSGSELLTDPRVRRLQEIAGVDIYTLRSDEFKRMKDKSDLDVLPFSMPDFLAPPFVVVKDRRSRGLAYFTNSVKIAPSLSNDFFKLRPPFDENNSATLEEYRAKLNEAYTSLDSLNDHNQILTETNVDSATPHDGTVLTRAWIGDKGAFETQCSASPCRLVVNMSDLRDWTAFVDGERVPITRTNYAFMSVPVTEGKHVVWFEYEKLIVTLSWLATLFSWIGALRMAVSR